MLTTAAVAARLGISEGRVRRLAAAGRFPGATRFGERSWAIPEAAVRRFRRLRPGRPAAER